MIFSKYSAATTNPHFTSMRPTNDLIIAARLYIAAAIVLLLYYFFHLRTLERCALALTVLQFYRTFPDQLSAFFSFLALAFRTSLWITLVDYCGEDSCRAYYESDLVGLARLRFCNCLRSGLYFTQSDELFACTDRYRLSSLRPSQAPLLRFGARQTPNGSLREYLNALRSRSGSGVAVLFDEDSEFGDDCQLVFKEITRLMRFDERYAELLAPRKRELTAPVRAWDKGVLVPGAWVMCTRDYTLVFQDLEGNESLCEIVATASGKRMYRSIFASRLADLERVLPGLVAVVRLESFGLVQSGWLFWGMNVLHSSSFDELFKYLLSGREVLVSRLSSGGLPTLVLGRKPDFWPRLALLPQELNLAEQ